MATFTKFEIAIKNFAEGRIHAGVNQLTIALSASTAAPNAATASAIGDITEIAYTNLSARDVTVTSSSQSSGTYKLICADLVISATGDSSWFRYVTLYESTAPCPLIGYWDYGSGLQLHNGESFTVDFDPTNGVFQLA